MQTSEYFRARDVEQLEVVDEDSGGIGEDQQRLEHERPCVVNVDLRRVKRLVRRA